MSRPASPNPASTPGSASLPPQRSRVLSGGATQLPQVVAALSRVRRRLRLQRALQHGVYGLLIGAGLALCATLSYRLGALSQPQLLRLSLAGLGLFFVGVLVGALRRIEPLAVAARIDQSHALYDRLSSALQFAGVGSTPPPSPLGPEAALRELAIADAEQAARGVEAHRAAPFVRPQRLGWIPILGLLTLGVLWIRLPQPSVSPPAAPPPPPAAEARFSVEPELIAPEKDELARLLADAEQRGDEEAAAILRELQKLLQQVERGELTRKEAFDKLSELEQRLMRGKDGSLEELKEKLRKAGNELSEAKLTRELGQALAKEDLAKAQAELKKLASEALSRAQSEKEKSDRQAMAKAFERAAQGLRQSAAEKSKAAQEAEAKDKAQAEERARRMNELQAEERRLKQKLEKNPQDQEAQRRLQEVQRELEQLREQAKREQELKQQEQAEKNQKDQWQGKTREEERTRRTQELEEEERRLKKKLQDNPQDEESERRLKKVQRELEQLEREKQEREQARRELEQLERDMQKAAEEMQKQLDRMSPEQRKALEKMMEDMQRLQEQLRRMGGGQGQSGQKQPGQGQQGQGQNGGRGPVTIALGSIKQVLRRVGRSSQGQGGQGQQGQQGQGQGQQGQGQSQGQGMSGSMKDFMNRAKGQGQGQGQGQGKDGESDVLIEGEGQGKDGQSMILLGQGNDPVLIPGLGMGPGQGQKNGGQGQNPGPGSSGNQPGGERPGTQHDPNLTGDVTQIDSKRRLTRVYGKEGAGPTRSETILGAAEKGFASQPYRKVYGDYTAVSERAMTQQRVPPGYRFYVKRYFQMIKPRE